VLIEQYTLKFLNPTKIGCLPNDLPHLSKNVFPLFRQVIDICYEEIPRWKVSSKSIVVNHYLPNFKLDINQLEPRLEFRPHIYQWTNR
jgi:hypothetical protein